MKQLTDFTTADQTTVGIYNVDDFFFRVIEGGEKNIEIQFNHLWMLMQSLHLGFGMDFKQDKIPTQIFGVKLKISK